jgi:hypothetical protein
MSALKIIAIALVILWFAGFLGSVGGNLIHALIVIALVVFVFDLLTGRKAV